MPTVDPLEWEAITEDDEAIAAALEDVSVPALMMSMVHMTGDPSILRGAHRPAGIYLNEVQGFMSPEDQAAVRAQALEVIRAYRDRWLRAARPPPDDESSHEMMNVLVAQEVPDEYVPLIARGARARRRRRPGAALGRAASAPRIAAGFHVVVIGAGMSGLLAGIRLGQAGIPYTVVEKNAGVGRHLVGEPLPGLPGRRGQPLLLLLLRAQRPAGREFFARQPELQAYFDHCLHRFGVADHVRFGTEVRRGPVARTRRRAGSVDGPPGRRRPRTESSRPTCVISAVGQLNRPKLPDIPGRDRFDGAGHALGPVGGGHRPGRQAGGGDRDRGPAPSRSCPPWPTEVAHLTVFQRSAPWMFPNPHYHDRVGPGRTWALRHLPYYGRWYRFLLFWPACDGGLPAMRVDPDWPDQSRSISEVNDAAREVFTQWMADQIGDDAELLAKVVPDYVCLGKRTLQDNGSWLGRADPRRRRPGHRPDRARSPPTGIVTEDGDGSTRWT